MRRPLLILLAFLAIALVAAVPLIGAAHRRAAREDLAALLARHQAEGHGASFADLAASAPVVDRAQQARARSWMKERIPVTAGGRTVRSLAWRLEGGAPGEKQVEAHEAFRSKAEELESLFARGDLCLTSLGWLPADPDRASFSERVGGPIPNLLAMREAYRFFAEEAALTADPAPSLDQLDRLHAAIAKCGCLIDSMITLACDVMRDEAYLVLALAGAVDDERLDAWLAEAPRGRDVTADGLRGERLRFAAPLAQDLVAGGSPAEHMGLEAKGFDDVWNDRVLPFFNGPRDCAVYLDAMLQAERCVRGEIGEAQLQPALDASAELGRPFGLMFPNLVAMSECGARSDDQHAAMRAAYVLMKAIRTHGRRPENDAEAHAWVEEVRPALATDAWRCDLVGDDHIHVVGAADPAWRKKPGAGALNVIAHGVEIRVR